MLKVLKCVGTTGEQKMMAIEGARNSYDSWDRIDSGYFGPYDDEHLDDSMNWVYGENDTKLLTNLSGSGPSHSKYKRMLPYWMHIVAPLYFWKEWDTYKVGTVCNSCSTMHTIHKAPLTVNNFSTEHLLDIPVEINGRMTSALDDLKQTIAVMNYYRECMLEAKTVDERKRYWWQIIQKLPSSFNQRRTVFVNSEVLTNIYDQRLNHRLDEWQYFCNLLENNLVENELETELITTQTVYMKD